MCYFGILSDSISLGARRFVFIAWVLICMHSRRSLELGQSKAFQRADICALGL